MIAFYCFFYLGLQVTISLGKHVASFYQPAASLFWQIRARGAGGDEKPSKNIHVKPPPSFIFILFHSSAELLVLYLYMMDATSRLLSQQAVYPVL